MKKCLAMTYRRQLKHFAEPLALDIDSVHVEQIVIGPGHEDVAIERVTLKRWEADARDRVKKTERTANKAEFLWRSGEAKPNGRANNCRIL